MGSASRVAFRSLWSLRLAPSHASPSGSPRASLRSERFAPFASICGVGAGLGAAERRLGHRPVGGQPGPIDADDRIVVEQPPPPDLVEDAGSLPLLEAAMGAARVA